MSELPKDIGSELMTLLCAAIKKKLSSDAVTASEMEVARKVLTDNSITFASVQRGDFGAFAQTVANETYDEFAGDETGAPRFQ